MKRFPRVAAPPDWATRGLAAGIAWLAQDPLHPHRKRPKDLWSQYRPQLAEGFGNLCGYTIMWKPEDETVDHFVPWTELRGTENAWRAYDWDNLRLSVGWLNKARKGQKIPDPYLVEDSWFELRLPSLELEATDVVPAGERAAVDNVLRWLRKDRRVMKPRLEWFRMYREGELSFAGLVKKAPLIAAALRRQPEYLLPADRERSQAGTL